MKDNNFSGLKIQRLSRTGLQIPTNGGISDGFILKFDNSGNRLWASLFGGTSLDVINDVAIDQSNSVYVVGRTTTGTLDLLEKGNVYHQSTAGSSLDAFISVFDKFTQLVYSSYLGGLSSESATGIGITPNSYTIIGNAFTSSIGTDDAFCPLKDPGGLTYFQDEFFSGNFSYDGFISKFSSLPLTGVESLSPNSNNLKVRPNPSYGYIEIIGIDLKRDSRIEVRDMTGRMVFRSVIARGSNDISLNLSMLSPAVYQISIFGDLKFYNGKIVIQ